MIIDQLRSGGEVAAALIEQPWARVKSPPAMPGEETLARDLAAMTSLELAHLIRAHLLPRENEVGGRQRWVALWETIAADDELSEKAFDALEGLLDTTEDALAGGELDDAAAVRARKFRRACSEAWKRVQNVEDDSAPLAWAGRAATGFNPVARRVIAELVAAVDQHRQSVLAADLVPSEQDRRLWAVLAGVGLDPRRSRRRS
jgi:hypothetical protein